jgi:hypothetical protein
MLRIEDVAFEIDHEKSEFFAFIPQESPGQESPGRLCWSIGVYCVDKENERGFSAPNLYVNTMAVDVTDWRSMEGQTVQNMGIKGLAAYLDDGYINERTSDNMIRFLSRQGEWFTVEWKCFARLLSDDDDSSPRPLRLDVELAFQGIHIWWVKADAQGLETAKELVGRQFVLGCLQDPGIAGPYHIVFPPRLNLADQRPSSRPPSP